jgi:hypothetical protein
MGHGLSLNSGGDKDRAAERSHIQWADLMTIPKLILGLAVLAGMAWLLWRAWATGKIGVGVYGDAERRKEPIVFWFMVALYGFVFVALAYTMYSMGISN